jgi:hypothetical protein
VLIQAEIIIHFCTSYFIEFYQNFPADKTPIRALGKRLLHYTLNPVAYREF